MGESETEIDDLARSQFKFETDSGTNELISASILLQLEGMTVGVLKLALVPGATEYFVMPPGVEAAPPVLHRFPNPYQHGGITQLNASSATGATPYISPTYQIHTGAKSVIGPGILVFELDIAGPRGITGNIALSINDTGGIDVISQEDLVQIVGN